MVGFCAEKGKFCLDKKAILSVGIFFCRCDAGDSSGADKFYKKAAEYRDAYKPLLADIVEETLGNDNSMSDEVLDNLLQRSKILKKLFAMDISIKNKDMAGSMSACCSLLTKLGKAR